MCIATSGIGAIDWENFPNQASPGSTRSHSSPVNDELVTFMLACRATTQIHFIAVDIESAVTHAPAVDARRATMGLSKCRELLATSALNTILRSSPAPMMKQDLFNFATASS
ncbi:hypothetical protein [Bradyrhizobium elkanii]|uniref:hypothetical protein n=1 Tax=Bradyrhizobium elkanii TaxID=29448 RepID=UPI0014443F3A